MVTSTARKTLRRIVEEIWVDGDFISPYDMIDSVLDSIDPDEYRDYLADALRLILPTITGNMRRKNLHGAIRGDDDDEPVRGGYTEVILDPEGNEVRKKTAPYSFKIQQRRDAWAEFLDHSIPTDSGERVRLSLASVENLRFAAQMRRDQADALGVGAEKYDALAGKMVSKGVDRLDGLTSDDVRGIV